MSTARIVISGDVQKHAFRKYLRNLAVGSGLFGYVQNLKDYKRSVEVVCQGPKEKIDLFLHQLNSLKAQKSGLNLMLIKIEEITPPSWDTTHPVTYTDFDIIRGDDEAGERFDEGIEQLMQLRTETTNNFTQLDTKYGAISATMNDLKNALIEDREEMKTLVQEIIKTQKTIIQYIASK